MAPECNVARLAGLLYSEDCFINHTVLLLFGCLIWHMINWLLLEGLETTPPLNNIGAKKLWK